MSCEPTPGPKGSPCCSWAIAVRGMRPARASGASATSRAGLATNHVTSRQPRSRRRIGGTSRIPSKAPASLCPPVWTAALQNGHMEALHVLVHDRKPARAIVGKAVDLLREVATSPASKGMISEQCTSIVLPSDPGADAAFEYHAGAVTEILGGVAYVEATGGSRGTWILKPEAVRFRDSAGAPILTVPKVGRNQPCPCGTGKKYKHCHGRVR